MSTQKFPMVSACLRPSPRTKAIAIAMPVAAEKKLCDVRATIWEKYDIVLSPPYDCQFVLVVNDAAVLNAKSGVIDVAQAGAFFAPKCIGFNGSKACRRKTMYVMISVTKLKMSMAAAYVVHFISSFSFTPQIL